MHQPRPLTRDEVRTIDRIAIEQYAIPGIVLMENAGRGACRHILEQLQGKAEGRSVVIACGGGNNGGDGLVIARHLHNAGARITIVLCGDAGELKGDAAINFKIVEAMKLPAEPCVTVEQVRHVTSRLVAADLIVDALLGTGFEGQVRSPMKELIEAINMAGRKGVRVVAIDMPSGLDCDSGQIGGLAIRANMTVTFVAPKIGMLVGAALTYAGRMKVVDIGVPREIVPTAVE